MAMQSMREGMKSVLWIVAIAFVASLFFVGVTTLRKLIGGGKEGAVVVVEGKAVSPEAFDVTFKRELMLRYRKIQEQKKTALGEEEERELRMTAAGAALNQTVQKILFAREAKRMGIRVTDDDVRVFLEHNPSFQENGRFNQRLYENFVREQTGLTPGEFEGEMRDLILQEKVISIIGGAARVSKAEAREFFDRELERARVEYAFLPIAPPAGPAPAEEQLKAYYAAHQDRYHVGERLRIRYVLVDLATMRKKVKVEETQVKDYYYKHKNDRFDAGEIHARHILFAVPPGSPESAWEDARRKAEAVAARIQAGEDFGKLATELSQDPGSAANGGDLGWFARGSLDPDFEKAAFEAKPGVVSAPVKSLYGYHLIKREPDVEPYEVVKNQIYRAMVEKAADEQAMNAAMNLRDRLVKAKGKLDIAAEGRALGYQVKEPTPFAADGDIEGLGPQQRLATEAFTLTPGEYGSAIPVASVDAKTRTTQQLGYVVYLVAEKLKPGPVSYEQVKEAVSVAYTRDSALDALKPQAEALAAGAKKAGDLKGAAAAAKAVFADSGEFTRRMPPPTVGYEFAFVDAAFKAQPGAVVGPIRTSTGYYVFKLAAKTPADPALWATRGEEFRASLLQDRRQKLLAEWYRQLVSSAKIENNLGTYLRSGYFTPSEKKGGPADDAPIGSYY